MHLRKRLSSAVRGIAVVLSLWAAGAAVRADAPQDAEADKLLKSAQDAYAKKDFPTATSRFRDVTTRYPKTASAPAATFGLAVCLIEGHDKNNA